MVGGAGEPVVAAVSRAEELSRATVEKRFDPYVDIDWDAPENALDKNDPRWQHSSSISPLGATTWYAEQPLNRRIAMGRWLTANTLKVALQFEMMLIRGVVHSAGRLPNGSPVFQYLLHEIADECNHIQMFQDFINRTGDDVPGMRRGSRIFGPILAFIGGYASVFHFIGVLCGEQPLHFQQTLQHRGTAEIPPLLNRITYIHLAEEARHIAFVEDHLAEQIRRAGRFRRACYAIALPLMLRWLIGEMITPPRAFARQFGIPRRVFKDAFWRSDRSRALMSESAADVRRVAEDLGLRTGWRRWLWRLLGIDGRLPRYRGEPNRRPVRTRAAWHPIVVGRAVAAVAMAAVALLATPDGVRIIAVAAAGAAVWAAYQTVRARRSTVVGNQPFEWSRFAVWLAVCLAMVPAGGLIGLALLVFTILTLSEFMPTM
ncbi:diiron oxygenase [[Mycobacterium] kokjensenii]|uniref:Diiron oxygenase n=2 Tax=[Mycobacterium] kokjensenii TaxID=3064287 RepID=A0ABM9LRG4_9MYCO|nr:diiron oxygenase [Mycolicibacter sp. MU0083]